MDRVHDHRGPSEKPGEARLEEYGPAMRVDHVYAVLSEEPGEPNRQQIVARCQDLRVT
jgi:hypothetical protein